MFAHDTFSEFSQEIGLASLGASELDINRLAAIYWYTIEFGMCKEDGALKAYGAGILSSMGEIEYCVSGQPILYPLDVQEIAQNHVNFPISKMQPHYFVAESFEKAKE
jgi:phenylalanine-4-hydroxylase